MNPDTRRSDQPLVNLANQLESLIADKSGDFTTANKLLNVLKGEFSKAELTASTIPIVQEIERTKEIVSQVQTEWDNLNLRLAQKVGRKKGLRRIIGVAS